MEKILYITFITFFTFVSCKAQTIVNRNTFNQGNNEGKYFKDLDNNFDNFIGTWEHQNGNEIFRVTLWKVEMEEHENGNRPSFWMDALKGHYEKVEVTTNTFGEIEESVIYTSQKKIGQSNTDWIPVISGGTNDGSGFGGLVYDNSIPYNPNYILGIRGHLDLDLISGTNPIQMQWKVRLPQGMYGTDQPTEFNIPTDIILTKVE